MKKLLLMVTLLFICACVDKSNSIDNQKLQDELKEYAALEATEANTKKFIEDYLRDVNSSDWKSKLPKYLQPNPEAFLKEHTAFRESFPNYKATIKHLIVDGNEGIVWINVTTTYAVQYSFESEDDSYGDNLLKDIKAGNQPLSWDETWYFDVVDGKFGEKFDFLKDNYKVLQDLKVAESSVK